MRRTSFNVFFFIKKTKLLKNGEASVCIRITVDGQRVEILEFSLPFSYSDGSLIYEENF